VIHLLLAMGSPVGAGDDGGVMAGDDGEGAGDDGGDGRSGRP